MTPAPPTTLPRVCILPYGHRLGWRPQHLRLSDLLWPLGVPPGIEGQTLADLRPTDHLLVLPQTKLYFRLSFGTPARVSLMFLELRAVHHKHMVRAQRFHRRFHRILTADSQLLASLPNAAFFAIGGSWVPDWHKTDRTKRAMCSLIASEKREHPGHRLRHEVVTWIRGAGHDVAIMGRGYRPFAEKSDGLAPFRYSVVIENSRETHYFTEKLVDALLCDTVPIYWGCPNIGDVFDTEGMILCEDMAGIARAIEGMSTDDYAARLPALARARDTALGYADPYARAAQTLLDAG